MSRQSTRNLVVIEPSVFSFNPETASTNHFQVDARDTSEVVYTRAITEFRAFRDMLVEAGASVTTLLGAKGCPDAVFPNWFSTHDDGTAFLYPMMAPSRRRERTDDVISFFRKFYNMRDEYVHFEIDDRALEGTGSMVLDRVGRIAYAAKSRRTDEGLFLEWCMKTGYEPVVFETVDHAGGPVVHTNLVIWIGTEVCGVGTGMIVEADRDRVLKSLARTREVLELDNAQIRNFCGNALEIRGYDDQSMLVMSDAAYGMLTSDQISRLNRYYTKTLHKPLGTIETYGGGSARAIIQELF